MKDDGICRLFEMHVPPYLDSVQEGSVMQVWGRVVEHYLPRGAIVVDLTYRSGRMWSGFRREQVRVIALDLDQEVGGVDAIADCRYPPLRPLIADAVVFDPPWAEDAGRTGYAGPKYNCGFTCPEQILDLVRPEAWARITRPDGFLFVRCADYHHEGRFVDLSMDLSTALRQAWKPWDKVIHVIGGRPPRYSMVSPPKTRKIHSYFLVFRRQGTAMDHEGGVDAATRSGDRSIREIDLF